MADTDHALRKLYDGLARATGLAADTEFARELAPINLCYYKWCLGEHDPHSEYDYDIEERDQRREHYIRQSIPLKFALPKPIGHPDHEGSDVFPCACGASPFKDNAHFHCPCGKPIKHAHLVYHREDKAISAIVGSCCIKRFMPTGLSRLCNHCHSPHANRKNNLCANCRLLPSCQDCETIGISLCEACKDIRADVLAAKLAEEEARKAAARLVIETRRKNNQCIDCASKVNAAYERCYTCALPNICLDCPARIGAKWRRCYKCNTR